MSENEYTTQLAVIGAGPGGYPAAFFAADSGICVTLIDSEPNPGGVCLYRGCIPTKTLLHVAEVIQQAGEAEAWGVHFDKPKVHIEKIRSWKDCVVQKMTAGLGQLCRQRNIEYIQGRARFLDSQSLEVTTQTGVIKRIAFENVIVSSGSHPASIPGISTDSPRILFSDEALDLPDIPKTLLVVGGGYIGLEMGTIYATLGSEVSVVEMMPDILPGADSDLVRTYSMTAKKCFRSIMTNTTVTDMEDTPDGINVNLKNREGATEHQVFDKVLVTIGRKPNSEGLGLENTRVKIDGNGFVCVDPQRRTAEPSVYAIGDIVGGAMLAHKATHEGRVAVEAILGRKTAFQPKAIPAVLFTDPEVAWCGLTENEAKEKGVEVQIAKFPWGASGRAASLGRMDGLTKLIIDPGTEVILGVGLVGPGAGELISEGALAVEQELKASDLARTIHPHPTLSETLMEAAEVFYGHCTHVYRPKR
ncbi:MAG: dihydrolipoyl dehydrogenase [bacterium]